MKKGANAKKKHRTPPRYTIRKKRRETLYKLTRKGKREITKKGASNGKV